MIASVGIRRTIPALIYCAGSGPFLYFMRIMLPGARCSTSLIYARIHMVAEIRPGSFWPEPEVTSSIIELAPHQPRPALPERLHALLERAFQHRRKQLGSSLASQFQFPADFDRMRRPETLSLQEWIALANFQTSRD